MGLAKNRKLSDLETFTTRYYQLYPQGIPACRLTSIYQKYGPKDQKVYNARNCGNYDFMIPDEPIQEVKFRDTYVIPEFPEEQVQEEQSRRITLMPFQDMDSDEETTQQVGDEETTKDMQHNND